MTLTEALSTLDGKAELTAADAITLRQIIFGDDLLVTQAEADALFKLNADAGAVSPEWRELFIEALADFVVRQQTPSGYVDEAKAKWLMAAVSQYGRIREDEIEMLIHVLEQADRTPPALSEFVLGMIKSVILWKFKHQGGLAPADIERLRRVLFSEGGEGNVAVTRHEAEILFDINDALGGVPVDAVWTQLFVRAVSNAVLFASPWKPHAEAEFKREAWLADTRWRPFQRIAGMWRNSSAPGDMIEGLSETVHLDFHDRWIDEAEAADEALVAKAEALTAEEAHWLVERIGRNGQFDANEQALVAFIRANGRSIDPALDNLIAGLEAQTPI